MSVKRGVGGWGVGAGAGTGVGVYLSLILFVSFCFFFCFLKNAVLGLRLGLVNPKPKTAFFN